MIDGVIGSLRPDGLTKARPLGRSLGAGAGQAVPSAQASQSVQEQLRPVQIVDASSAIGPAQGSADLARVPGFGDGARQNLFAASVDEPSASDGAGADGLTPAQEDQVRELAARDREVKAHEEAHARVGGQYAGQPSYTYQLGPDGKRYAIGGEVPIDIAPVPDDPEATIEKMRVVKAAALAPAEPSGQDRAVAQLADAQRLQAQAELNQQRTEERIDALSSGSDTDSAASGSQNDKLALLKAVEALERADQDPGSLMSKAA